MDQLIEQNRSAILRIAAAHGSGRAVRVFGSMARGEARPDSDVDLLIDISRSSHSVVPRRPDVRLGEFARPPNRCRHRRGIGRTRSWRRIKGSGISLNRDKVYVKHILECLDRIADDVSGRCQGKRGRFPLQPHRPGCRAAKSSNFVRVHAKIIPAVNCASGIPWAISRIFVIESCMTI